MSLSPWFWDLLLWNRCPGWLTILLLFKFTAEGLLYVIHVERTDCWTSDAVKRTPKEDFTKSETKVWNSPAKDKNSAHWLLVTSGQKYDFWLLCLCSSLLLLVYVKYSYLFLTLYSVDTIQGKKQNSLHIAKVKNASIQNYILIACTACFYGKQRMTLILPAALTYELQTITKITLWYYQMLLFLAKTKVFSVRE